jgi:hypothetical protein
MQLKAEHDIPIMLVLSLSNLVAPFSSKKIWWLPITCVKKYKYMSLIKIFHYKYTRDEDGHIPLIENMFAVSSNQSMIESTALVVINGAANRTQRWD